MSKCSRCHDFAKLRIQGKKMEEKQKRTPFSHWEQLDEAKKEQLLALMEKGAELERSLTEEQRMAKNLGDLMNGERVTIEGFIETVQPYTTWSEETREEVGRVGLYVKQADEKAGYFKRIPLE